MADDMRADDLRWMPATRRLIARHGVSFANSFVSYPLCCPSRASFLTGQYAHNHGVVGNHRHWGFHAFDDSSTIATDLRRAGYRTSLLGKYLNDYGIDPPYGRSHQGSRHYVPPGWTMWLGAPEVNDGPLRGKPYNYRNTTLSRNGVLESHRGEYNTRTLGRISRGLIRRWSRSPRPFFLFDAYAAPHSGMPHESDDPPPLQGRMPRIKIHTPAVTAAVRGRFDALITEPRSAGERVVSDKPAWVREMPIPSARTRAAMVESERQRAEALAILDRQVARTMSVLRHTGELSQTVVIFTSDNGWFEGEHRIPANKTVPYDPALRVPLLIRAPGLPHGVVRAAPVVNVDLAPTIDELAHSSTRRTMDGRSLLPIARHPHRSRHRAVLTETGPFASLDIWIKDAIDLSGGSFRHHGRAVIGVRTLRYAYLKWASGEVELYDLRRDPGEQINVAGRTAYAQAQARLAALLRQLRDCKGATCMP
jgi:arylsulfatase A-like enzyme